MIKCSTEEQLARESVMRSIDRTINLLQELKSHVESSKNLYYHYFPGDIELAISYGKLMLLSEGYTCQNSQEKN